MLRGQFLPADRRRLFFGSALPRSKALLGAITLILVCTYLVSGVRYALYAPATSDNYLWAVYHVHSTMSDGLDSPLEIARQARMARVALAHGGFHLGKWFSARVPSYYATFSLAGLGIDRKHASQPGVAIRSGDFFNCMRGAGEPLVFDYFATNGASKFTSGSTAPEGSALHARVQTAGQTVRLVLI